MSIPNEPVSKQAVKQDIPETRAAKVQVVMVSVLIGHYVLHVRIRHHHRLKEMCLTKQQVTALSSLRGVVGR